MKKNLKSEEIQCPNFSWKLFQRDGVYYADGRKHGKGKSSLGTRKRAKAIKAIFELDRIASQSVGDEPQDISLSAAPLPDNHLQPITIASGCIAAN